MKNSVKHNIVLIGFMGSGKTSVGVRLAERLAYHFRDTDKLIEIKSRNTINHIFAMHGEEHFRNIETELLWELLPETNNTVLSTGGGLPLREGNVRLLKELGYVVFLKTSKLTTLQRLAGDNTRPLLQGKDLENKVEQMLAIRSPIYEKAAHKIITTDDRTIEEIVHLIMEAYLKLIL